MKSVKEKTLAYMQSYRFSAESYSPMFSTIGLQLDDKDEGVQSLFFHYNRETRTIFEKLISFHSKVNYSDSTPQCILFGDSEGKLAFYDTDAFVFESYSADKVVLCEKSGENVSQLYKEKIYKDKVFIRCYSDNIDGRDPDKRVPILIGIRVINGTLSADENDLCVKSDESKKITFAFYFSALEISVNVADKILSSAPDNCDDAKARCEKWISDCIGKYEIPLENGEEKRLVEKAIHSLTFNLAKAQGNLNGYISAFPNRGTYPTHFLWDSCFQNLAYEEMNTELAENSLLIMAKNQREDGKIPQFICSTWVRPLDSQPALIGWATLRLFKLTGNEKFAKKMLRAIEKNNNWWLNQRVTECGLISCWDGLETGQDDSPRFDNGEILASDMNSYLLSQMRATAEICDMLSMKRKADYWRKKSDDFSLKICDYLYDEKRGIFADVFCETGEKNPLVTSSLFLPLWAGVKIEESKAKEMIENYLLNPEYLFGDVPFPSVAYNQPSYESAKWWRGPTWLPIAWLMLETLEKYGYEKEKMLSAKRLYDIIIKDKEMHELFNSQTGEGLGSVEQGWTCAIFLSLRNMLK